MLLIKRSFYIVTQEMQHVPELLPFMLFGRPSLLAQCVNVDVRLCYAAVQNLVYLCENVPHITAESSDTPPIHYTQHMEQSVNVSIQLPAGLQCDPVQMAEVVQQEYVLVGETWLYPRVNIAKHFPPLKAPQLLCAK